MPNIRRPAAFWLITAFLVATTLFMLAGQTMSVFHYDLTVRLGFQESAAQVGVFGVQVNRAFGAGDTVVYVPLLLASLAGLWLKKRWSLFTTAAVAGVSAYWSVTAGFMFLFLPGAPGYNYVPATEILLAVGLYAAFGVWGLTYLIWRGETLLR